MNTRPSLIDFIEKYTREYSEHVYLREKINGKWEETTYKQTREYAHKIGAGLMSIGVQKDDKISLLSEGRNWWMLGEFGILYAGAVNVPLSIKLEESNDLIFRVQHSDSKYIMTSASQLHKIRRILPNCPLVKKVIVFDKIDDLQDNEIFIEDLIKKGEDFLRDSRIEFEERYRSIQPDDYANISYTSGTTADPKGILLTHRNYTANVEQACSVMKIEPDSVMLVILPVDHCFAHVAGIYTMMRYCSSLATVPIGHNALATLKNIPIAIKETKPMLMLSVPALARNFKKNIETAVKAKGAKVEALYNFALRNAINYYKEYYNRGGILDWWRKPLISLFDKLIFKNIRENFGGRMKFFVGGGALLDIELQRYFNAIGIPMLQGYGLSEATPIISANSLGNAIFGSSGRVVKPMDIKICDSEGKELPYGEKGEIVIRGENVMAGYWKNPEATAKTVIDGWLHTGDMGYMNDPTFLYVVGRFKSLLISSDGEKYSPEGFEDAFVDSSKYVNQCILYNNQNPYTIVVIVPDKEALSEYARSLSLDPKSVEGKKAMLSKLQEEVDVYKTGGARGDMFPDRWLPSAIVVAPEAFTEQNKMVNSTMKIVRNKVEEFYKERIEYAYTAEGKDLFNQKNIESL